MKTLSTSSERILAVSPCKRGFAFVIVEADRGLVDWGVKRIKHRNEMMKVDELQSLIARYAPDRVITQSPTNSHTSMSQEALVQIADSFTELAPRFPQSRKPWEGRNPNAALYRAAALAQSVLGVIHKNRP